MAINKNFVIKNGVEVNTSLIVGDATLNKVGVGTTVPGYTLHVGGSRGGIGATDLTVTGIATVGTSGSTSAALSVVGVSSFQGDVNFLGSAGVSTITFDASLDKLNFADNARATFGAGDDLQIFHDGSNSIIRETGTGNIVLEGSGETLAVFADDGAVSLYYDDANVFQTTPQGVNVSGVTTSARLNVSGISTLDGGVVIGSATSIFANGNVTFAGLATANGGVQVGTAASIYTNGNVAAAGIVTANGGLAVGAAVTLASNGNAGFTGIVTAKGVIDANGGINASSAKIEDLTDNRVIIVGTGGELEDDSNFTFDGAMLKVGTAATVAVNGNAAFAGIVTVGGDLKVTGDLEISEDLVLDTNLNLLGIASISNLDSTGAGIGSLSVTGVSTFSGDLIVGVSTLFADVSAGRIGIGTAVPASTLDVDGALTVNSAKVEDLTDNRIVIAGSSGELEDDSNLTFDGVKLNVGSGVTIFPHGGAAFAGIVTVGGDLNVQGDIVYDEITGRNLNITGFSTFANDINVNGTTFFVDVSEGQVGIGTDIPGDLNVNGDDLVVGGGTGNRGITVFSGTSNQGNLYFADGKTGTSDIRGGLSYNHSTDGLSIRAAGGTEVVVTNTEVDFRARVNTVGVVSATGGVIVGTAVTIQSNGAAAFVGVVTAGTALVTGSAKVEDLTDNRVVLAGTDGELEDSANLTFDGAGLVVTGNANISGVSTLSNDLIVGVSTLFADVSSGRIGIGTDVPSSTLEVVTTSGARAITVNAPTLGPYIAFETDGTAFADIGSASGVIGSGSDTDTLTLNARGSRDLAFRTNSNERLRVTSAGLVGIGTDNPDRQLHVISSNGTVASFESTNANTISQIVFQGLNASTAPNIGATGADFHITTGNNERLRITSAGRVNTVGIVSATGGVQVAAAATIFANGNATFSGISTFGGTSHIRVPVGTTDQRPTGVAGDFRYNTTTGNFEGYTDSWGAIAGSGGGGVTETDTSVSTTTATGVGSFAVATHRSASIIAQIDQGGSYQVGRYLMIHDGTTATVIEESAVATGDMLGSFSADINNSNAELKVTMNSSGIATVTTKIDSVTV